MVRGELAVLLPIWSDLCIPLPFQEFQIFGRPGARHPVRIARGVAVARTSGEVDYDGHAESRGQFNGPAADVSMRFRHRGIGMQRVAVTAQRADREAQVVELLPEA